MKCDHCPLAGQSEACRGERNARFCQRADPASVDHSPGFLQKIANFAVAAVQHVAVGAPMASEDVKAARLAVCVACDQFDRGSCRVCGCGLETKAGWADQECPVGKWGPIVAQKERAAEAAP